MEISAGIIDASALVDHPDRTGERGVAHHARVQVVLKANELQRKPQRQSLVAESDAEAAFRGGNLLESMHRIGPLQPDLGGFSSRLPL